MDIWKSRNLELVSTIMTLDIADKVPGATREDLEQLYDTINEGARSMIQELTRFFKFN